MQKNPNQLLLPAFADIPILSTFAPLPKSNILAHILLLLDLYQTENERPSVVLVVDEFNKYCIP